MTRGIFFTSPLLEIFVFITGIKYIWTSSFARRKFGAVEVNVRIKNADRK